MSMKYAVASDENLSVDCIICGSPVKLNKNEKFGLIVGMRPIKVCQRCKDAVEWASKEMPLIAGRDYNGKHE